MIRYLGEIKMHTNFMTRSVGGLHYFYGDKGGRGGEEKNNYYSLVHEFMQ